MASARVADRCVDPQAGQQGREQRGGRLVQPDLGRLAPHLHAGGAADHGNRVRNAVRAPAGSRAVQDVEDGLVQHALSRRLRHRRGAQVAGALCLEPS